MSSLSSSPSTAYVDVAQQWDLDRLYLDLAAVKRKKLSETEKICLRGLLCGTNPADIATTIPCSLKGLRVELSKGLYRYIEQVSQEPIKNWAKVSTTLERAGYRRQPQFTAAVQTQCLAFSPDGRVLASTSSDCTIKLWDVASGQSLRTLQGHTEAVMVVAFSPDGQWLASCSYDQTVQTVKLWDLQQGQCLQTLQGHTSRLWTEAFSPHGHWLTCQNGPGYQNLETVQERGALSSDQP